MQRHTRILFVLAMALAAAHAVSGQAQRDLSLTQADSLFSARQYTQAFERYAALHHAGQWSPAMFLKMAFIQEGLGHLGNSLYYLNLYEHTAHDPQAAEKMRELAEKHRLEGYEPDPYEGLRAPLREFYLPLAGLLAALGLLLLALITRRAYRNLSPSPALAFLLVLCLAALYTHTRFSRESARAIVTHANAYLMSGPSGGASVVGIIGEGHQLRVKDQQDAWLKVRWQERDVFVRDFLVRKVEL